MSLPVVTPETQPDDLAHAIVRLAMRIRKGRGPNALHPRQVDILRIVNWHPTVPASDVAEALRLTHAPVSRSVAALQRRGFILARVSPADRRERWLTITKAGKKALDENDPSALITEALADFHPVVRNDVAGVVERLLERLP